MMPLCQTSFLVLSQGCTSDSILYGEPVYHLPGRKVGFRQESFDFSNPQKSNGSAEKESIVLDFSKMTQAMDIIDISVSAVKIFELCHEQPHKRICIDTVTEMVQWGMKEVDCNKKEQKMFVHLSKNDSFHKQRTIVQKKLPKLCWFPPVQLLERFSLPCEFNGYLSQIQDKLWWHWSHWLCTDSDIIGYRCACPQPQEPSHNTQTY